MHFSGFVIFLLVLWNFFKLGYTQLIQIIGFIWSVDYQVDCSFSNPLLNTNINSITYLDIFTHKNFEICLPDLLIVEYHSFKFSTDPLIIMKDSYWYTYAYITWPVLILVYIKCLKIYTIVLTSMLDFTYLLEERIT